MARHKEKNLPCSRLKLAAESAIAFFNPSPMRIRAFLVCGAVASRSSLRGRRGPHISRHFPLWKESMGSCFVAFRRHNDRKYARHPITRGGRWGICPKRNVECPMPALGICAGCLFGISEVISKAKRQSELGRRRRFVCRLFPPGLAAAYFLLKFLLNRCINYRPVSGLKRN